MIVAVVTLVACGGSPPAETTSEPAETPPVAGSEEATAEPEETPETATANPLATVRVYIYFPSDEDDSLHGESREIFNTASPVDRAKQIVSDLISGPRWRGNLPSLPAGTRLRQIYVMGNGIAYCDFTSSLKEGMSGGTTTELMAVYSIVNSLVLNIREIDRVGILIEGRPCETLNGHLDLRRPLPPKLSLLPEKEFSGVASVL